MPAQGRGRLQTYVRQRAAGLSAEQWVTSVELAREVYGDPPTRAQVANVTRTINTLADRGEVVTEHVVRAGHVVLAIRGR